MKPRPLLIAIKLGGSLITDKTKPLTPQPHYIAQLAREIKKLQQAYPDATLLIGNGGGSFGHFYAHRYGLKNGAHTSDQRHGSALTHAAVQRLNSLVVDALTTEGLPAFSVAPSAVMTSRRGEIYQHDTTKVRQFLRRGYIPVVYGDVVLDDGQGVAIISTERVLQAHIGVLRHEFEQICVLYLCNVGGVLDRMGRVIPRLAADDTLHIQTNHNFDVTGGMLAKVAAARQAARLAETAYILDGREADVLVRAVKGESVGTRIE